MWKNWEFISGIWNNQETDIVEECDIELMQYTWLKDKNWVEIYEGDIYTIGWRWWYHKDDKERKNKKTYFNYSMYELRTDYSDREFWFSENDIEVIGNIYQNPELLVK